MVNNFYIVCLFWCSLVKRCPPENEHEVYSYDETTCDSQVEMRTGPPGRLCLQLLSENLLLNGYRAKQFGMHLQILVDCTYSMTTSDDFATMHIGVIDLSQQFHVVAYAVLNHEDTIGQEHALRETKKEVELVVQKYRGTNIWMQKHWTFWNSYRPTSYLMCSSKTSLQNEDNDKMNSGQSRDQICMIMKNKYNQGVVLIKYPWRWSA